MIRALLLLAVIFAIAARLLRCPQRRGTYNVTTWTSDPYSEPWWA